MCRKTVDSIPEYNRQGFKNKIMEKSYTRLILKVKKPTAKQMRPIALTDVSYKLFMTILGKKIDRYILENNKRMETQAGFTTVSND